MPCGLVGCHAAMRVDGATRRQSWVGSGGPTERPIMVLLACPFPVMTGAAARKSPSRQKAYTTQQCPLQDSQVPKHGGSTYPNRIRQSPWLSPRAPGHRPRSVLSIKGAWSTRMMPARKSKVCRSTLSHSILDCSSLSTGPVGWFCCTLATPSRLRYGVRSVGWTAFGVLRGSISPCSPKQSEGALEGGIPTRCVSKDRAVFTCYIYCRCRLPTFVHTRPYILSIILSIINNSIIN